MAEMSTLTAAATVVRTAKSLTDLTSTAPYVMNRAGNRESHTQALDAFYGALGDLQCSQTEENGRHLILALRLIQTRCEPLQVYLAERVAERAMHFAMLAQEPVEHHEKWLIRQHRHTSRAIPGWWNIGKRVSYAKQNRVIEAQKIIAEYRRDHRAAPSIATLNEMSTLKQFKADLEMVALKNWAGRQVQEPTQRANCWTRLDVHTFKNLLITASILLPIIMALSATVASILPICAQAMTDAGNPGIAKLVLHCLAYLLPLFGYDLLLDNLREAGGPSPSARFLFWVALIGYTVCFAAGWHWHQLPFWDFIPRDHIADFIAPGPY
ncbi:MULTISPECIES: hypothetical protein [unclassified Streptomyces]|uniref:hypothetical protein n=1 Tax=unclassified Streptomyces TaxID=2593676 RepID=UPI0037F281AB